MKCAKDSVNLILCMDDLLFCSTYAARMQHVLACREPILNERYRVGILVFKPKAYDGGK